MRPTAQSSLSDLLFGSQLEGDRDVLLVGALDVHKPFNMHRAEADKDAGGLLLKLDGQAALIVRNIGDIAERILDGEFAMRIDGIACIVRSDDPRALRSDLPNAAVLDDTARVHDLIGRLGAGDEDVVRYPKRIEPLTRVDDRSAPGVLENIIPDR